MTMKIKIITAIVGVICFAGLAIGIYFLSINFGTIKTAVSESQQVFTKEQLEAAKIEAYNKALGDKAVYEKTIASLNQQLIEKDRYWQKKYDDMVAEKDAEIERLTKELNGRDIMLRKLGDFMLEYFQIILPENVDSTRGVLDLQLSAYSTIRSNLEMDKAKWQNKIDTFEGLDEAKARLTELNTQLNMAKITLEQYQKEIRGFEAFQDFLRDSEVSYGEGMVMQITYKNVTYTDTNVSDLTSVLKSQGVISEWTYQVDSIQYTFSLDNPRIFDYLNMLISDYHYMIENGSWRPEEKETNAIYDSYFSIYFRAVNGRTELNSEITRLEELIAPQQELVNSKENELKLYTDFLNGTNASLQICNERIAEIEAEITKWEETHSVESDIPVQGGAL